MIESGSHTPGVSAESFGLPAHTALRYERPDRRLAGFITDYHVLDSEGPEVDGAVNWALPSWPAIRVILADRPISVTLGDVLHDPMPEAALYGTTSRAMRVQSRGGVSIGAGITPLGWSRFFDLPADRFRDRIVALDTLFDPGAVEHLIATLRASDQGPAVKAILDRFFIDRLGKPHPAEADIRALTALLLSDDTVNLADAAASIAINEARLRRLSKRFFGFPPKILLSRVRFMRSFLKMYQRGDPSDYSGISRAYVDTPHFLRDARRFLGMTPRRFMQLDMPYIRALVRARNAVFSAPVPLLDDADPPGAREQDAE